MALRRGAMCHQASADRAEGGEAGVLSDPEDELAGAEAVVENGQRFVLGERVRGVGRGMQ